MKGEKMKTILDIKTIREKKGMTQEALANKSGVNRSLLNQLETQKVTNTSTNTLQKLANALDCKITDLFLLK